MKCKHHSTCKYYEDNSETCNYNPSSYCGAYIYSLVKLLFIPFIFLFLIGFISAVGTKPIISNNMWLYYQFNNGTNENGTFVKDFGYANKNNGTLNNTFFQANTGIIGDGSMYFNGNNSNVKPTNQILPSNGTISFWFNPLAYSVIPFSSNLDVRFTFNYLSTNNIQMSLGNPNVATLESNQGTIYKNEWSHVALVYNTINSTHKQATLYINGINEGSVNYTGLASATKTLIGMMNTGVSASAFNGSIDEVIIYNSTLNDTQILNLVKVYSDKYYLNYTSTDFNVTYEIFTRFNIYENFSYDDRLRIFNGIIANATYRGENYYFRPFTGGLSIWLSNTYYDYINSYISGVYNVRVKNYSILFSNSTLLSIKYNISDYYENSLIVLINYSLENKSLHIFVNSGQGNETSSIYAIKFGMTGGEKYKDLYIDKMPGKDEFVSSYKKKNLYCGFSINTNISESNTIQGNRYFIPTQVGNSLSFSSSGSQYIPSNTIWSTTGGIKRAVVDELVLTVSDNYFDIYQGGNYNGVSTHRNSMNSSIIMSTGEHSFFNLTNIDNDYLAKWNSYGFKNVLLNYRGSDFVYNEYSPTSYPIANSVGGLSAYIKAINDLNKYGYKISTYFNPNELYTFNEYYSLYKLAQNSTGGFLPSWTNPYMEPPSTSYVLQPYYYYLLGLNHSKILNDLGTTNFYIDVLTTREAVLDYNYSHYNNLPYANLNGSLLYSMSYTKDLYDYIKNNLSITTWGEGWVSNYRYVGIADYFFAHRETSDQLYTNNFPDVQLKYMLPYSGMVTTRGGTGEIPRQNKVGVSDQIQFWEISWVYYIVYASWSDKVIFNYYYLTNAIQKLQQSLDTTLINVSYYNGTNWLTLSDYLRPENYSLNSSYYLYPYIKEVHPSGLTIYINKGNTTYYNVTHPSGTNYTLYPNMTIAWNTNISFFEYFNSTYSVVNSSDYYFKNINNDFYVKFYKPLTLVNNTYSKLSYLPNANVTYGVNLNNALISYSSGLAIVCNGDCNITLNPLEYVYVYDNNSINSTKLWTNVLAFDNSTKELFLSSNINSNDGYFNNSQLFNFSNNVSILLDDFSLTETYRTNSPIWFSSSTNEIKHIASNLTDTVNVTVSFNVASCTRLGHIIYTPNSESQITYNKGDWSCSNNVVTFTSLKINPSSESNELLIQYTGDIVSICEQGGFTFLDAISLVGVILTLILIAGVFAVLLGSFAGFININPDHLRQNLDLKTILISVMTICFTALLLVTLAFIFNGMYCTAIGG